MSGERNINTSTYRKIFDCSPFASIIIGWDARTIHDANEAVEVFGYSGDELVGMDVSDIADVDNGWADDVKAEHPAEHGRWTVRCKDGREESVLAIYFPIEVEGEQLFAVYLLDDALGGSFARVERVRQFQVLLRFSSEIAASKTLSQLYRVVVQSTMEAFEDVQALSLWVYEGAHHSPQLAYMSGHDDSSDLSRLADAPDFKALGDRKTIHADHAEDGFPQPFVGHPAFAAARSVAVVPLRAGGEPVAMLILCRRDGRLEFGDVDERLLRAFAAHAGIEIQRLLLIEHIRDASNRLIQAQEAERRAISQDIHDEIGGLLSSLRLMLKMTQVEAPSAEEDLAEGLEIIDELIGHVRDLAFRLSPRMLVDLGLVPTIRSYAKRFAIRTRVEVAFHCEVDTDARFAKELESTAFRVVQESLTNASRHAGAQTAEVYLHDEESSLVVHVIDDGKGFDPEAVAHASEGMGLLGLKERLELIGGDIEIASAPGEGTRITAILPK